MTSSQPIEDTPSHTVEALAEAFPISKTIRNILNDAFPSPYFSAPTVDVPSFLIVMLEHGEQERRKTAAGIAYQSLAKEYDLKQILTGRRTSAGTRPVLDVSPGLWIACEVARDIRRLTGGADQFVGMRHLLFVLLTEGGAVASELALGSDTFPDLNNSSLLDDLIVFLHGSLEPRESWDAWGKILAERGLQAPALTTAPPKDSPLQDIQKDVNVADAGPPKSIFAVTDADDPWQRTHPDRLHAEDEAMAFAMTVCATSFEPPLAVGIFGDWGSGKSFFLKLLYQAVEKLRDEKNGSPTASPNFLTDIVQVRFNAWHYVETNLWASLVDRIFASLEGWYREKERPDSEAEQLLGKLSTARRLTLESAEQLVRRRRSQRDAAQSAAAAQSRLQAAEEEAARSPSIFWKAVSSTFVNDIGDRSRQEFEKDATRLGLGEPLKEGKELKTTFDTLNDTAQRAAAVRSAIIAGSMKWWLVAGVIIGMAGLPFILECVFRQSGLSISNTGLGISSIVAPPLAALTWLSNRANAAVCRIQGLQGNFESALEKAAKDAVAAEQQEASSADHRLAILRADSAAAAAQFEVANQRLAEAARDYNTGTGRGRLLRFVRERAVDGEYARHLSLTATVRKDFDDLSAMVASARNPTAKQADASGEYAQRVGKLIAMAGDDLTQDERVKLTTEGVTEAEPPGFQRIVLYIDDLDRCPPTKVIDVLQAVHLLLTFPLFVVFVAVDVRWLKGALNEHYDRMLTSETEGKIKTATALDYLEKIFQVPYWVRPMTKDAADLFIADRLGPRPSDERRPNGSDAPRPGIPIDEAPLGARPAEPSVQVKDPPTGGRTSKNGGRNETGQDGENKVRMEPDAEVLRFTTKEYDFMRKMSACLDGSPRRTLRFINVYRIIKSSLAAEDRAILEEYGYAGLMTMLAIVIGDGSSVIEIDRILHENDNAALDDIIGQLVEEIHGHEEDRRRASVALGLLRDEIGNRAIDSLNHFAGLAGRFSFYGTGR